MRLIEPGVLSVAARATLGDLRDSTNVVDERRSPLHVQDEIHRSLVARRWGILQYFDVG